MIATPALLEPLPEDYHPRVTKAKAVVGANNRSYPLNQPLVPLSHYPRGQWAANVKVAGIVRQLNFPTAVQVFNEAMRLHQLNKEDFWFVNVWLNLNLQWIPRLASKYRIVTVEQLEAISKPA